MKVLSIGEVLWDIVGESEFLGGAPFNFAAHLRQFAHDVYFLSAVGLDERGDRALREMERRGLDTQFVSRDPSHATGSVTVSVAPDGQPNFAIHRPAAYDFPQLRGAQIAQLLNPPPEWIYFGTLLQTSPQARSLTDRLLHCAPRARRFYDVNLRSGSYNNDLIRDLLTLANVVKLNREEVFEVGHRLQIPCSELEEFCRACAMRYQLEAVCVTRGADGCSLLVHGSYCQAAGYRVKVADAIGAGDAFAAAFLHAFSAGWDALRIADFANRVGALVASRPGALPSWTIEEALALA